MSDCIICNDIKREFQDSTCDLAWGEEFQENIRGVTSSTNLSGPGCSKAG